MAVLPIPSYTLGWRHGGLRAVRVITGSICRSCPVVLTVLYVDVLLAAVSNWIAAVMRRVSELAV